jgi:hypothetical protein
MSNRSSSLLVKSLTNLLLLLFINNRDCALESGVHGSMIGEFQRSSVVVDLTKIVPFGEHTIAPCRDASLVAAIILVGAHVVFVCWQECDQSFVVVGKCLAVYHLKVELRVFNM